MNVVSDLIPSTSERVARNTAPSVNDRTKRETPLRIDASRHASPNEIEGRIQELDREWDIERILPANMSVVLIGSLALGFTVNRRWSGFSAVVAGFFLQRTLQGWCPPIIPWRRAGVRTNQEINAERQALKMLRGDFGEICQGTPPVQEWSAEKLLQVGER